MLFKNIDAASFVVRRREKNGMKVNEYIYSCDFVLNVSSLSSAWFVVKSFVWFFFCENWYLCGNILPYSIQKYEGAKIFQRYEGAPKKKKKTKVS